MSATPAARDRRLERLLPLLVFLAVIAAFAPTLTAAFVNWDDDFNITENYHYRGLAPENLAWMATTTHMGPYQPLAWFTLALDWKLWGMNPHGYHLTNVLLHALSAVALFFLAKRFFSLRSAPELRSRMSPSPGSSEIGVTKAANAAAVAVASCFASLLWATHPLRVESVAWITERRDVLSAFFFLLTLLAWLRWIETAKRSHYLLALILFLLSLLSKASTVTLPLILLLLDIWPLHRRNPRNLLLEKLPFLLLSLLFGLVALHGQASTHESLRTLDEHNLLARLSQSSFGFVFYLWKTIWPAHLTPMVELPRPFDPLAPRFVVAMCLVLALGIALLVRRRRALAFAVVAYAILLAPTSGLLQAGIQLVADRYSHLPAIPLALLAGGALLAWIERRPEQRVYAVQLAGGVLLVLGVLCFQQCRTWRDSDSLWTRAHRLDPDSPTALQNLGALRLRQGDEELSPAARRARWLEARTLFDRGIAIAPNPQFLVNRGLVAMMLSDLEPARRDELLREAIDYVERGLALAATTEGVRPLYRFHRGVVLVKLGRYEEALPDLDAYARENPSSPLAHRMLSVALTNVGRHEEALAHVDEALRLEPQDATLWIRRGLILERLGRATEALAAYRDALSARERSLGANAPRDPDWQQASREIARLRIAH